MAKTRDVAKQGFFRSRYHLLLATAYAVWWFIMAVNPVYREDWLLENLLVFVTIVVMWWMYPQIKLSNASYTLLIIFLALHTLGSHYTYAETPLGFWISDLFGLERNHYDRIIHFGFGLTMFWPMREIAKQIMQVKEEWAQFIGLLFIISMSALYEAIEWMVAAFMFPEADLAIAFLGTQGDVFDAQKDHALAIGGGIISFFIAKILTSQNRLPKPS